MDLYTKIDGKLLHICQNKEIKGNSTIYAESWTYDKNNGLYQAGKHDFNCPSSKSLLVACVSCFEILTDSTITVLLLENLTVKTIDYYLIGITNGSLRFVPLRKLSLMKKLENFKIVDGPTIAWIEDGSLFIANQSSESKCQLSKCFVSNNSNVEKLLLVEFCQGYYILFGIRSVNSSDRSIFSLLIEPTNCSKSKQIDVSKLVSPVYTNVCGVLSKRIDISKNGDNFEINSSVFACTDSGNILQFENGILVLALYTNTTLNFDVQLNFIECVPVNKSYLSIFSDGKVTIINIDSRMVVDTRPNVNQVLCDDFIGNGCNQLMFMTEQFDGKTGYILTDVDINHIDTTREDIVQREGVEKSSSTATALTALQSRLRNEVVSLNDLTSEVEHRKQHITELLYKTQDLCSGTDNTCNNNMNVMLVPLLGHQGEERLFKLPQTDTTKPLITICHVWKRIIEECVIVGVEITNKYKSNILVAMTMASSQTDRQQMTFASGCFDLEKSKENRDLQNGNALKRRKLSPTSVTNFEEAECYDIIPGHSVTLLCKTGLPRFTSLSEVKYTTFLYVIDSHSDGKVKEVLDAGEITLFSFELLESRNYLCLSSKQKEQINQTDLQRNLLALNFVQIHTPLCVRSTTFPLTQLVSWLQSKTDALWVDMYDCLVFKDNPVLKSTRLYVEEGSRTETEVKMEVFTSTKDQLYLLLHHLYSVLPDDVIILPSNEIKQNIIQLLDSLQQEIAKVCQTDSKMYSKTKPTADADTTIEREESGQIGENIKQNFVKRKLHLQVKPKMSSESVEELGKCIHDLQVKSDVQLIKMVTER